MKRFDVQCLFLERCLWLIGDLSDAAALLALQSTTPRKLEHAGAPPLYWYVERDRHNFSMYAILEEVVHEVLHSSDFHRTVAGPDMSPEVVAVFDAHKTFLWTFYRDLVQNRPTE